jgi:hypothetical protein
VAAGEVAGRAHEVLAQRKAGMDISYKGIWGYAPLIVSLANTTDRICPGGGVTTKEPIQRHNNNTHMINSVTQEPPNTDSLI